MIEMGTSAICPTGTSSQYCSAVGVENVFLEGAGDSGISGGIDNQYSQDGSYVNNVNMHQVSGTGLNVAAGGVNSGPYTNIAFSAYATSGAPTCVNIGAQTRGLHGITCVGSSNTKASGDAAIYVNASNNSVENVHVESYFDAIEVGNVNSTTVNNVFVSNVTGSSNVTNVVRICGPHANDPADFGNCNHTSGTVTDTVVLQAANLNPAFGGTVVEDDVTSTSIQGCAPCELPAGSAIYTLGESVGGGYSRFATTPANSSQNYGTHSTPVPTWGAGQNPITSGSACLTPGALYSNTSGGSGTTIYVCTYSGWLSLP
jgi:hypothetical protein